MYKRILATAAAVATLTGGVAVPAQAVQVSGYNSCNISYTDQELDVLHQIQDNPVGKDLQGIYINSGYTSARDAAVIAKVVNFFANHNDNSDVRIFLRRISNANRRCAGDEYNKTNTTLDQAQAAASLLELSSREESSKGEGSSQDSSSSEDKGSSDKKNEDSALSTKSGELTDGGIALVVTAVVLVLGLLASAVPGLHF